MPSIKKFFAAAAAVAVVAVATTACTAPSPSEDASTGEKLKIIVISGPLTDPFFGAMAAGAQQAGEDLNVDVQYTSPKDLSNIGPDLSRLGDAALAAEPDAVVVGEFVPDAQDPGLTALGDAGVPIVFMNAGPNWEELGGLTFIGENPTTFGGQAGSELAEAGATHALCVNHVPGNPTLEARCTGFEAAMKEAGGSTTVLTIPADQASNPTSVTTAISGALRSEPSLDAVFTMGSGIAENAARAISESGSDAMLATGDLSTNVLDMVKSGEIVFAIDQQPFLQAYYAVLAAVQQVRYGLHPIGAVTTAPLFITEDNVDETIEINDANNGIRGAA